MCVLLPTEHRHFTLREHLTEKRNEQFADSESATTRVLLNPYQCYLTVQNNRQSQIWNCFSVECEDDQESSGESHYFEYCLRCWSNAVEYNSLE